MIVYLNNKYVDEEDCRISPFDRGFLFADGVYEVVKYTGKKFFEFESHIKRLKMGLEFLGIDFKDADKLIDVSHELIEKNNLNVKEAIIYIQITRGISNPRSHTFSEDKISPTVFINASPFSSNKIDIEKGIKVILEEDMRWSRCDVKTIALLPNVLSLQKAKENKAAEAIFVRNGFITEGAHTNFFGIHEGSLITPPLTHYILPGITRKVIYDICSGINIPLIEQEISVGSLKELDECFIIGTTSDITPVIQIDDLLINNGKVGSVTRRIQMAYLDLLKE